MMQSVGYILIYIYGSNYSQNIHITMILNYLYLFLMVFVIQSI